MIHVRNLITPLVGRPWLPVLLAVTRLQAQQPNAWQITDHSLATQSAVHYTTNLPMNLQTAATNIGGGFRYSVNGRFLSDFGGTKSMAMGYGLGDKRFFIWFELDANGDLTAELEGSERLTLSTNGTAAALYHTHEIIYEPATATASYRFDGQVEATAWPASSSDLTAGQVYWGGGSSPGQGQMNYHSVSFQITNTVVAAYEAGTSGLPPVTPGPQVQAWTVSTADPPTNAYVTAVSPDKVPLPTTPSAGTLAATPLDADSALLSGSVGQGNLASTASVFVSPRQAPRREFVVRYGRRLRGGRGAFPACFFALRRANSCESIWPCRGEIVWAGTAESSI